VPIVGPWLVLTDDGVVKQRVEATVTVLRHEHQQSEMMDRLPISFEGPRWTYTGDAHGIFGTCEVVIEVPAKLAVGVQTATDTTVRAVKVVNKVIGLHTSHTATLWTPYATPGDIHALEARWVEAGGAQVVLGPCLGSPATRYIEACMKPIFNGRPPPYAVLRENWDSPWAEMMLDAIRELMAMRAVRAASLATIAVELCLNAVLRSHLTANQFAKAAIAAKGGKYYAEAFGRALNNRGEHGEYAVIFGTVSDARNNLLHRQHPEVSFKGIDKTTIHYLLDDDKDCGLFIADCCRLLTYLAGEHDLGVPAEPPAADDEKLD
jgi:hypothetical protein